MKSHKESIKVCVRMRPILKPYEDEEVWTISTQKNSITSTSSPYSLTPLDMSNLSLSSLKERDVRRRYADTLGPQTFHFDNVFAPHNTSQDVYQVMCSPIIGSVMKGFNGAVLMYGQTTSGKTYTMLGVPELPGVLPCAIKDVFNAVSQAESGKYNVWVSYLEIYNEQINDLLEPGSVNLKIKEDKEGVSIRDLSSHQVWNFEQVIMVMNYGEEHRMYRETSIHDHSSRSHTIFKIFVESKNQAGKSLFGCMNLVDLAGSERLNEFEVRGNEMMGETGHINKSLFVLANVINKLAEGKKKHIPYRDSKLTRILGDALGGNSLAAIICTVSPAAMNFHQTLSTLRFATRAKSVQNTAFVNEYSDGLLEAEQFKQEIAKLKSQLDKANFALNKVEQQNRELTNQLEKSEPSKGPSKELEQKYKQVLQNLRNEQQQKAKLEQELNNHKKALEETQKELEKASNSQDNKETDFISDMLQTINTELSQELSDSKYWHQTTLQIAENYKKDLLALQDTYANFISQALKDTLPSKTQEFPEDYFSDIQPEFSSVLEELLTSSSASSEVSDMIIQKLKSQYERFANLINQRFEEGRANLESYYKEKVSSPELDATTVDNLRVQHSKALNKLKTQYDFVIQELEEAYVGILKVLDEYLSSEDKMQEIKIGLIEEVVEGEPYFWGSGKDGRCGLGDEENVGIPARITEESCVAVESGYHHSACITLQGQLLTWGRGLFGQLGHGKNQTSFVPLVVEKLSSFHITQVSCGWQHTMALTSSGRVFSWGYGQDGQLGHGDSKDSHFPREISALREVSVSSIACGHSHSGCVGEGSLYMWGCNPDARCFMTSGEPQDYPVKIQLHERVKTLSLGVNHSGALCEDGSVVMGGLGTDGQLGCSCSGYLEAYKLDIFDHQNPAEMVSCGDSFTAVLDQKGFVWSFGKGDNGRLGLGDTSNKTKPIKVDLTEEVTQVSAGSRHAAAVSSKGNLFMWGFNFYLQIGQDYGDRDITKPVKIDLEGVRKVSCGYFHTGALCSE